VLSYDLSVSGYLTTQELIKIEDWKCKTNIWGIIIMDWKCRESEYKKPEYNDRMSNEAIQKSLMKNASHKMGKWKKTARI
jgi:hypothetical protein